MTNKTNGIDVSECEFYEEMRELPDNLNGGYYIQHCYCGLQGDNYCICNKNPDCYFKQLKRLQEENKELKEKIKSEKYIKENALQESTKYSMKCGEFRQNLKEIREIAKFNQFYNPEKLLINGDIGQIQNIKMTEIYEKCNEVLNDRDKEDIE